jgi:hypothetical protein
MSVIDTLATTTGAPFTVNAAVDKVNASLAGTEALYNGVPLAEFRRADNAVILSMGVVFPYCFNPATKLATIQLQWIGPGGTYDVTELDGTTGTFIVPLEYRDYQTAIFVKYPVYDLAVDADTTKELHLSALETDVGMHNVPASLDAQELHVQFYAKVIHTLPLA